MEAETELRAVRLQKFADEEASEFHRHVSEAADESHNEREFQTRVDRLLSNFAKKVGVELLFREEYTLAKGRADAVYNRLVIEYEAPRSLRSMPDHGRTAHSIQQAKDYLEGLAARERHDIERLLGAAFDGQYLYLVRFREGSWEVDPALEWNPAAAARLLRSVVSLSSGRALIPQNLVADFGAGNEYSQRATRALYEALDGHDKDLVAALFSQWQVFFSEVSGYEEATVRLRGKRELREFAEGMGLSPEATDPPRLIFAIHTYFSFLAKAIARLVLERYAGGDFGTTPLTVLANLEHDALREELSQLEEGGIFSALGFVNLLEGDFFSWYLHAWSEEVQTALQLALRRLAEYNPATIEEDPYAARDLLKKLYHYLLPRELRHDLGEYYTPDWLATRLLAQLGEPLFVMPRPGPRERPDFSKRLLDPACGSGTFLILAIRAIKEHARREGFNESDTLELILNNVVGIDLNPLAVLAARVGYLLAIADLVPYRRTPIVLPVYLADSILIPTEGADLFQRGHVLDTVVGRFPVPKEANSAESIGRLTDTLYEYVEAEVDVDTFVSKTANELGIEENTESRQVLGELYAHSLKLKRTDKDGIWARILKNAFMPLFIGSFHFVAGNPPWINWESLPDGYRQQTSPLWQQYGLTARGRSGTPKLGSVKVDISTLMTYVAADRFLKPRGRIGFLITQSVFKNAAGAGFRSFRLPTDSLRVVHVDDMSELRPFEGAANRTAVLILQRGGITKYPVPYTYWRKTATGRGLSYDSSLDEVLSMTARLQFQAVPVNDDDETSPWLCARPQALKALRKILGSSDYRGYQGVNSGGANGAFWVQVLENRADGLVVVRNVTEGTKRKLPTVTWAIEPDLLFPLLRSSEVSRWHASPSLSMIVPQDPSNPSRGLQLTSLQEDFPHTYSYLTHFRDALEARSGYKQLLRPRKEPFYAVYDIGSYTFKPFKVVWRRIASDIEAAVVDSRVVPQDTITLVPVGTIEEAQYVAAVANSSLFRFAALAYSQVGAKSFGSPHILENIRVPRFDRAERTHSRLVNLARKAAPLRRGSPAWEQLHRELDETAGAVWSLSQEEVEALLKGFRELQR